MAESLLMKARNKNSARFETYYKIDCRNARLRVWMPLQRSFPTLKDARNYVQAQCGDVVLRIIRVSDYAGYEIVL